MDPRQAKLQTLQDLIGAMDEHMLGPVKAKKQAAVQPPMAPPAEAPVAAQPTEEGLDADAAAKLRKLYEDEFEQVQEPVQIAGSN